jgi:tRNA-specific 2-thiouridylase
MKSVYVGMSGGVDSSVTAALLKQQGYKVTGVYMKNWSQDFPGFVCPWQEDYRDAKRVAVDLNIDFKMYDFEKEYRHKVVDYMVKEYQAGRTPNPDIMCNQEVKFKLFLSTALSEGADLIATGHYSRIIDGHLYAGKDKPKDQSYFLYRVNKEALSKSLMPIGDKAKTEVRALAKDLGLSVADKKDSQGICFVGEVGIKEFLINELGQQEPGPIINQKGETIGEHEGAIFYTIGQRHGLNVGGGLPYYVIKKDVKKNIVYVTTKLDDENLWRDKICLEDIFWIDETPKEDKKYKVRIRYRGPLITATIKDNVVYLEDEVKGVAAGQSTVIYDNDKVLGGGIVSS